jgi:uncharacterized protein
MSAQTITKAARGMAALAASLLIALAASAQVLSSPVAPSQGAPAPAGAGYHDPRSPIPPLQERADVLSWKLLSAVQSDIQKSGQVLPRFPKEVRALNNQRVRVQGFMMPLEPGARQSHFLLSAVPTTCSFCVPAGPEGLVEVRARKAVDYGIEAIVLEGRLAVLDADPYGVYYRLADAAPVKP